jgi:1-acyl-sn-glycerol-3-phosphate acyltransferase
MNRLIKILFFALIVKPIVFLGLGLNIINRDKLPSRGPAVITANHNSHLDTMVLMSLYPLWSIHNLRPVAAADYFLKNRFLAWFSKVCIGIIPLDRTGGPGREEIFADCHKALDNGEILILFPEGSRGKPEKVSRLKKGIYHLIKERNDTSITPVVMHGLGRALPKGTALFVPFNCDVVIGDELDVPTSADAFIEIMTAAFGELFQYCLTYSGAKRE